MVTSVFSIIKWKELVASIISEHFAVVMEGITIDYASIIMADKSADSIMHYLRGY